MGKKNKRMNEEFENEVYDFGAENVENNSPVPYPMQFSQQDLSSMDDEVLHNVGRSLQDSINRVNRLNLNPYPWEVELCYLQQEVQVRSIRRARHAEWLSALSPAEND